MSEELQQKIFEVLKSHKVGGGVYEWTLHDVICAVLIEHNDYAPSGAAQCADHILRQASRSIAASV